MKTTKYHGFNLPELTDLVDPEKFNQNFTKIDSLLGTIKGSSGTDVLKDGSITATFDDLYNQLKSEIQRAVAKENSISSSLSAAISSEAQTARAAENAIKKDLDAHKAASNPHNITKATIGLSDVENKSSDTIRSELTSDNVINALGYTPFSEADGQSLSDDMNKVIANKVDKSRVVNNFDTEDEGYVADARTVSELNKQIDKVKKGVDRANYLGYHAILSDKDGNTYKDNNSDVYAGYLYLSGDDIKTHVDKSEAHMNNKSNPHGVTKAQVGLGNVNNTADRDKTVKLAGNVTGTVAVANGGTGATSATGALTNLGAMAANLKGKANGVAELDSNGHVPSSQLPSYVDDVLEYGSKSKFPTTGETGKIYVDTSTNLTYRWSGTAYIEVSQSLALGETSATAYRGDRGKIAYDHSQLTSGNPHHVTKADVGLSNVTNYDQSKAIKSIKRSGTTFTCTALDGTETKFDQKDDNTEYGVASKTEAGLVKIGDNITESTDGTINVTKKNVLDALGFEPSDTLGVATELMYRSNFKDNDNTEYVDVDGNSYRGEIHITVEDLINRIEAIEAKLTA